MFFFFFRLKALLFLIKKIETKKIFVKENKFDEKKGFIFVK